MELERRYFEDMRRYLRDELGVQSLLLGTADHNHGKSGYPLLTSTSLLDVVDGHVYWQHPRYLTDPASGRRAGFEIPNTPMVNDPQHSTVVQLSRSAMAGKPYTVSEVNHPFPNAYACEGIPMLAAYAALHDWDGVFWYTLAHEQLVGEPPRAIGHFDLGPDPVKMTQLAAGALLFLRADVRPAAKTVTRSYTPEQVLLSLRRTLVGLAVFYARLSADAALDSRHADRLAGRPADGDLRRCSGPRGDRLRHRRVDLVRRGGEAGPGAGRYGPLPGVGRLRRGTKRRRLATWPSARPRRSVPLRSVPSTTNPSPVRAGCC